MKYSKPLTHITMKEREFIEDLEALARQYWGKGFAFVPTEDGAITIYFPREDCTVMDLQDMVKQILGQP